LGLKALEPPVQVGRRLGKVCKRGLALGGFIEELGELDRLRGFLLQVLPWFDDALQPLELLECLLGLLLVIPECAVLRQLFDCLEFIRALGPVKDSPWTSRCAA